MIYKETSFVLAKPIWLKNYENEMNRTVIFETKASKGEGTILRITAQNSYQVFINDSFVFFGPARAGAAAGSSPVIFTRTGGVFGSDRIR